VELPHDVEENSERRTLQGAARGGVDEDRVVEREAEFLGTNHDLLLELWHGDSLAFSSSQVAASDRGLATG
jgi:hypothetical protein